MQRSPTIEAAKVALLAGGRAAVIVKVFVTVPKFADTIAQPVHDVATVKPKPAVTDPAGTTADAGIDMLAFVDRRVTVAAVLDACVSVTVQEPLAPGARVRGEHASCASDDAAGDNA